MKLTVFSPSGVIIEGRRLQAASKRLRSLGVDVLIDESARARFQRFAGTDEVRVQAIERVAVNDSDIVLAARGGYGLTRLLDRINWDLVAHSVHKGKRWVGHSDFTAFSLALLAHTGASSWAGPMAVSDFGRLALSAEDGSERALLDEVTSGCFMEAMRGELEAVGFRTDSGFDGLQTGGMLWGGNLSMLCSLLATPHCPQVEGGVLFLEDVNESPYRVERMLLQLHQAGILEKQHAIVLGDFGRWKPSAADRGYRFVHMLRYIRSVCSAPVLTGLPFGHIQTKLTLPVGIECTLCVYQREAFIQWGHHSHEEEADSRMLEDEDEPQCCCGGFCQHRFPV